MKTAVLDADVIAYIASAEADNYQDVDWGEGVTTNDGGTAKAKDVATLMVNQWAEYAKCDEVYLAFSGHGWNFRRDVHPYYKANRTGEKPKLYEPVVEWMQSQWQWEAHEILEGDDVIGMLVTTPGEHYVGVSTDKDLKTLPGRIVHITRDGPKYIMQSEVEANRWWMMQALMGDSVDGYKGAPGIGVKAATSILQGVSSLDNMWHKVVEAYGRQYIKPAQKKKFVSRSPMQEALMNARCSRILRHGDYNKETKEVRLWAP